MVIGGLWFTAWLGVLTFVFFIASLREKPLTSMEPNFHLHHVFVTHIGGAALMYVLVLAATGQSAWLRKALIA